jgi:hypothetical protein
MRSRVLSSQAELALRRLGGLQAFHVRVARHLNGGDPTPGSDIDRTGLRTLREAVLVRCMSVLEAYVLDLGREVIECRLREQASAPRTRALADYLVSERWARARSWSSYEQIWRDGIGLALSDFQQWEQVQITRGARNAIVHQFGEYNNEYRRVARKKLEGLGIDPDRASGRIPLDEEDVRDGLGAARAFVVWADPLTA